MAKEVWALLGASRGLGRAFFEASLRKKPEVQFLLAARKENLLIELQQSAPHRVQIAKIDLSVGHERKELWENLRSRAGLSRVFYFAGGGPYGKFSSKELKDHSWALETSFVGAMEALHFALRSKVKQIVFVGSSVAEDRADPKAASYSAAKHALSGLLKSVWEETPEDVDVRLFSPGYMDTSLLPPGATVRQQDLAAPDEIAALMLEWCLDPEGRRHYKLST